MTNLRAARRTTRSRASATGQVGYGRPPIETRFRPGHSGNPRGRPKGTRNKRPELAAEGILDLLRSEAGRPLTITEAGKPVDITMLQAVCRALTHAAVKGEHRSQRLLANLLLKSEADHQALDREAHDTAIAYKRAWHGELARRRELSIVSPDPVPHPDHVQVDWATGQVRVAGPMTQADKLVWDRVLDRRRGCLQAIVEIKRSLGWEQRRDMRQVLLDELGHEDAVLALVSRAVAEQSLDVLDRASSDDKLPGRNGFASIGDLSLADTENVDDGSRQSAAGEPQTFDPDLARSVLQGIARGKPLVAVCTGTDLPASMIRSWLLEHPTFAATYQVARTNGLAENRSDAALVKDMGRIDTGSARLAQARKWRAVEWPPDPNRAMELLPRPNVPQDFSALTFEERDQLLLMLEKIEAAKQASMADDSSK